MTKCVRCDNGDSRTPDGFHALSTGRFARCANLPPYDQEQAPLSSNLKTYWFGLYNEEEGPVERGDPHYGYEAREEFVSIRDYERLRAALQKLSEIRALGESTLGPMHGAGLEMAYGVVRDFAKKTLSGDGSVVETGVSDKARLDWLTEVMVDTIYLDDQRIIDVGGHRKRPHDIRAVLDEAMRTLPISIDDESSQETGKDECQHDLLKPNTTIEVIDPWKAKCKVCITFFDLPGSPVDGWKCVTCGHENPKGVLRCQGPKCTVLAYSPEKASTPHIHVWQKAPDSELALCACGDYSDDWYCPESPDHVCHYRKGDFDQCDYCGQPEERK